MKVHAYRVSWFCGKAQTQFADIQTVFTHRVVFIMFKMIENPALCEMRSVIRFLKQAEIRQLCDFYGEQALSISVVRRWVQLFNEWHENVHDDLWSGRLSVVNEDFVRAVEEKIRGKRRFTTISLSPAISLKFHCQFFTKFCLIKLRFGNCGHTACWRCLRKDTNWNIRAIHWTFWHNAVRKAKTSWAI